MLLANLSMQFDILSELFQVNFNFVGEKHFEIPNFADGKKVCCFGLVINFIYMIELLHHDANRCQISNLNAIKFVDILFLRPGKGSVPN